MKLVKLLNSTLDGTGNSYNLYFEIKESSLPGYADIRFYSTFSSAKDPEATQDKWKTTLPLRSVESFTEVLVQYLQSKKEGEDNGS